MCRRPEASPVGRGPKLHRQAGCQPVWLLDEPYGHKPVLAVAHIAIGTRDAVIRCPRHTEVRRYWSASDSLRDQKTSAVQKLTVSWPVPCSAASMTLGLFWSRSASEKLAPAAVGTAER